MVHLQPQFEAVDELLLEMVEPQMILEAVEVVTVSEVGDKGAPES